MVKIVELRKVIKAYLKSIHPNVVVDGKSKSRVFFQRAPGDAIFPYLVYDFPNSSDDGSMESFILDIDGWDDKWPETTDIETLMSLVDGDGDIEKSTGLHRKTVMFAGEMSATFYREHRLPLHDDDPRINRRKYIYQIRTHE